MKHFDNLSLDKSMYNVPGKSFSQILEAADPSQNYSDSHLASLDAFGRQLKRFDIKVAGAHSDSISKFFESHDSATLFPEYVSRAILQGMNDFTHLNEIIATSTLVDTLDYRSFSSVNSSDECFPTNVAEFSSLPNIDIKPNNNLVQLKKRGRILNTSYESIKYQKLDLFTITLRQIGSYIAHAQFFDAVNTIINGDGNNNPAQKVTFTEYISYEDLLALWNMFTNFNLTTLIVSPATMTALLDIPQLQNPAIGVDFSRTGKLISPLGANIIKSPYVPDNIVVALDKSAALEKIYVSDIYLEHDKLIDRQIHRTAISSVVGFAKIFDQASFVLTK